MSHETLTDEDVQSSSSRVSQEKAESNRRNSEKSTGPKTRAGKDAVRFNPVKHGFLSKQVVISSKYIHEDPKEYEALVSELMDQFAPANRLELLLVETVATCFWRSRRELRLELGEVRGQIENSASRRVDPSAEAEKLGYTMSILQKAKSELERSGKLSQSTKDDLNLRVGLLSNPIFGSSESLLHDLKVEINKVQAELVRNGSCEPSSVPEDRMSLPSGLALDTLLRYAAANDRRLSRTLDQLRKAPELRRMQDEAANNVLSSGINPDGVLDAK